MSQVKLALLTGVLLAVVVISPNVGAENENRIYWEAEAASSIQRPLQKILNDPNKKYSGAGYLKMPGDNHLRNFRNLHNGKATYQVKVKKAGTYFLWARVMWTDSFSNSIGISVNDGSTLRTGYSSTLGQWHWVGGAKPVKYRTGMNTIVLQDMKAGARIDRFFLTQENPYGYSPRRPNRLQR